MAYNILIIETNREDALWLQDRLELGLTDVLASVAFDSEDALQQMLTTKFDLVFFTHTQYQSDVPERGGVGLVSHLGRYATRYKLPKAAWVHTSNKLAAVIITGQLEQVCIPTCIHSIEWCRQQPTEFIETVQDILFSVPKEFNMPSLLLH